MLGEQFRGRQREPIEIIIIITTTTINVIIASWGFG